MKAYRKPAAFIALLLITLCSTFNAMAQGTDRQIQLDMFTVSSGNSEFFNDGLLVRYNAGYLSSTADDDEKVSKASEYVSSYRENKDLSQERRPFFSTSDTIFLDITNVSIHNYRFKVSLQNFSVTGLMAKVEDNYLHTYRVLDTYGITNNIDFNVTADPASADPFRFRIVIITARPLPVTFTGFTALQQGKNIALEWKVSNQLSISKYEVERSADGINFSKTTTFAAVNNGGSYTYNWLDEHTITGTNFYRICVVGVAGDISYSTIVSVKPVRQSPDISIYPNPVINNTIGLQFGNAAKGSYRLRLLNNNGQVLFMQTMNYNGNGATQKIVPSGKLVRGNYYLEISDAADVKITKMVSVVE